MNPKLPTCPYNLAGETSNQLAWSAAFAPLRCTSSEGLTKRQNQRVHARSCRVENSILICLNACIEKYENEQENIS
jgi:hypothetical protein